MPELPEVETVVRGLRARLTDSTITSVFVDRPDIIRTGAKELSRILPGRRIASWGREGKRILIDLNHTGRLIVHLGMSGRLTLNPIDWPTLTHTHLRIRFQGSEDELRFRDPRRFGGIWFYPNGPGKNMSLKSLGPDALSIRVPVLREITRRSRQIKALLMDQYAISGLGNIYCDEALFRAKIHPLTISSRLSDVQVKSLACAIRKVLNASLDSGGSTLNDYRQADGSEGAFQKLLCVYDREGNPCHRCGATIKRITAAGRSTHFCTRCQPRPHASRRNS